MSCVQPASLDWALNHALRFSEIDLVPLPFEYHAIQHDWDKVRTYLASQETTAWQVRPHRVLLSPKARYGFRILTQLDPLDFLLFAALTYEIGSDLEAGRVLPDRGVVFSYRFSPQADGRMYEENIGYAEFQEAALRHCGQRQTTHVVVADIADFYSRIYLHRLQGALDTMTNQAQHVASLYRLLKGWNEAQSYGIPIGNAPSRLLAEATIADVDETLLGHTVPFVRFNDDYRIFATGLAEGYRYLSLLATTLFESHGLTLQPQKTKILPVDEFRARYLPSLDDIELSTVRQQFENLCAALGLSNPYEPINYDDLDPEDQEKIDALNLYQMFHDALREEPPEYDILRFVLRRMRQIDDDSLVDEVFDDIDRLYPVFPDIMRYLENLRDLPADKRRTVGTRVLELLEGSIVSELEYHRMWVLNLFTASTDWQNQDRLLPLLNAARDDASKRELILGLARAQGRYWFQGQRRRLFDYPEWSRRALLAGMSCLPEDTRRHWYGSVRNRLDVLERAVAEWARANPF